MSRRRAIDSDEAALVAETALELLDEVEETDVVEAAQSFAEARGDDVILDEIAELLQDAPIHGDVGASYGWPAAARLGYAYLLRCGHLSRVLPHLVPQRIAQRRDAVTDERLPMRCDA